MEKIYGDISGLKPRQKDKLLKLYCRRIAPEMLISPELVKELCSLSFSLGRQIGLLIDRSGRLEHVIVGDHHGIVIPDTPDFRTLPGKLKGLRCIHTHLNAEGLDQDDIVDLSLLRLDMMAVITMGPDDHPLKIHTAHIHCDPGHHELSPLDLDTLDIDCHALITDIETEIMQKRTLADTGRGDSALLVSVSTQNRQTILERIAELKELTKSGGLKVAGVLTQQRRRIDTRFLMGRGKLSELSLEVLHKGADIIIFDQELNPSQIRSLSNQLDVRIIDRAQLILDIFAQRAQTREGRLQVELAQLKYMLPRLITKNTAMSRLTGGIGGRGPGETKLEINRRRVRERILRLTKAVAKIKKQRQQQKNKRQKRGLPIISIVGYTNAGKSTLLNTLTKSGVHAENRLFATLDPSSRRLKFPRDVEVIITDTVGFITDLPQDLLAAFRATLEELESANLLLHVIDISNPRHQNQIKIVEHLLSDLKLDHIPVVRVLNKKDRLENDSIMELATSLDGIPISALESESLVNLLHTMENFIQRWNQC